MNKLIATLLSLAVCGSLAWGQASGYQEKRWFKTITIDGEGDPNGDTLHIPLPGNRGKGLPVLYFCPNDVKSSADTDSLFAWYRPAQGIRDADTLDAGLTWTPLEIYKGPSGALTGMGTGAGLDWADSVWYMAVFDLDGYPWRYIEMKWYYYAESANDSVEIQLEFDID